MVKSTFDPADATSLWRRDHLADICDFDIDRRAPSEAEWSDLKTASHRHQFSAETVAEVLAPGVALLLGKTRKNRQIHNVGEPAVLAREQILVV